MLLSALFLAIPSIMSSEISEALRPPRAPTVVTFDRDERGALFAHGANYKMMFDATGAWYFPRWGSRAPTHAPIHFEMAPNGAAPLLTGTRVSIDRGWYTETYDIGLESVEQTFALSYRPHDGEIVFRIPFHSPLIASKSALGGLRFEHPGIGEVTYSDARIFDSAGNDIERPVELAGDAIEITLPDEFLDRARFPLVIDPVITTWVALDNIIDEMNSDVVYSPSNGTHVITIESDFVQSDSDIVQYRFDANGSILDSMIIYGSLNSETKPSTAIANNYIMTAWLEISGSSSQQVRARNRYAGGVSTGPVLDVSKPFHTNEGPPDVGATESATTQPYLITFAATIQESAAPVRRAVAIPVSLTTVGGPMVAAPQTEVGDVVRVIQQVKAGGTWLAVFESADNATPSNPEHDIFGFRVDPVGLGISPTFAIHDTPTEVDSIPDVGGDGVECLVTWSQRNGAADSNIFARRYQFLGSLAAVGDPFSFTSLDHPAGDGLDQLDPHVGYDGARFLVVYREATPGGMPADLFASTYFTDIVPPLDPTHICPEKHTAITNTSYAETAPNVASCGFEKPGVHCLTWTRQQTTATALGVMGGLFSSLGTGSDAVTVPTGCGTPQPSLLTSAQAVIGASYGITINNATSPLLMIGIPTNLPLCPGQASCALGVSPIAMVPVPTVLTTTIPIDIHLVDLTFALQVIDLLPSNATGVYCGPPKFSQKFRVTNTRVTTIR